MLLRILKQMYGGSRTRPKPTGAALAAARSAIEAGDLSSAEEAIGELLAANPDNAEAVFCRGLVQARRGNLAAALTAFRNAARITPDNPEYQYKMGICCYMLGDVAQARIFCETALRSRPDYVLAHNLLSQLVLPGPLYTDVLGGIHRHLAPRTYLEIGVDRGNTIVLADGETTAIGIDPAPRIGNPLGPNVRIYRMTSDEFFLRHDVAAEFGGRPIDLAFIDGMHRFDFALRDFAATERCCTSRSVVLLHDTCPLTRETAERDRITTFWSGDIWRLVLALKKYRPDLSIHTIATPPTGLTMVRHLNPESHVLSDGMDEIVSEFLAVDFSVLEPDKAAALNLFPNDWAQIERLLDQIRC